jgi:hypothetical protein
MVRKLQVPMRRLRTPVIESPLREKEVRAAWANCGLALFLVCLVGCYSPPADAQPQGTSKGRAASPFTPGTILGNMPMNSDQRCFGICLVAEALLGGEIIQGTDCDMPAELGQRIYDSARSGQRVRFRAQLCVDAQRHPIESRESLDRLSTIVADLYKDRYLELIATDAGRRQLTDAQEQFLSAPAALDQILQADPDHIAVFFLIGVREFPSGERKETAHVVLLGRDESSKKIVYDPNDPGLPIPCHVEQASGELTIRWTCRYRDTGYITTQKYRIVDKSVLFRQALNRDALTK